MPRKSHLDVEFAWEPNWKRLARALNVPADRLRVTKAGADVERLWVETPINDAWTSAARLGVQNGQIVVTEVRVFPNEPNRQRAGIWSAELLGSRAVVPPGGLTAGLLRSVSVVEPRTHTREALARLHQYLRRPDNPKSAFWLAGAPQARPRPERRGGRPDRFYAALAIEYERRSDPAVSRRPVADLAAAYRVPRARMRDMVREARERGLLKYYAQGRAGGQATPRAHAVVKARKQQTTTNATRRRKPQR